ncbi:MAG: RagB/SusD family nutrient uptake outer membrane protein, partial [Lutibacter sp.]|nr:RagB/SusD family nutrient uptake outer membrane protein [Lutibacter sp.]
MKKYSFKLLLLGTIVTLFTMTSCLKDLDTVPQDKDVILAETLFNDPAAYKQVLAKLYAGLAISGQQGPAGMPDI